ncbi:MAG: NepR family anti-sigma factor [Methylovirgula sp.]
MTNRSYTNRRKGENVTKPIELGAKKAELPEAELPKQMRSRKIGTTKGLKEASAAADQRSEAEIMTLPPARTRKPNGPTPEIFNQIGQRLRNVYNDVLTQTVPDRFVDLLQALEAGTQTEPPSTVKANTSETPSQQDRRPAPGRKTDQR